VLPSPLQVPLAVAFPGRENREEFKYCSFSTLGLPLQDKLYKHLDYLSISGDIRDNK